MVVSCMYALMDICGASMYILLKVAEVMWGVDLYKYNEWFEEFCVSIDLTNSKMKYSIF
jgi:hypothetical protein